MDSKSNLDSPQTPFLNVLRFRRLCGETHCYPLASSMRLGSSFFGLFTRGEISHIRISKCGFSDHSKSNNVLSLRQEPATAVKEEIKR